MPNGKLHKQVGGMTGAVCGAYVARNENTPYAIAAILGGALGGVVGGKLPDVIEPAVHPRHRSVAHAVVPMTTVGVAIYERWRAGIQECLRCANLPVQQARGEINWNKAWHLFLAGLMAGLAGGYVSHLVMDATMSKSSLPIFG
ncbi:MAG TPA: hypothetical protein VHQ47_01040 [Phycisphaerae bacterium]|nr:hypothetical protein [Phycisphaerae bacterium]HWB54509.1 hypothetical protein [Tepidisphaeraceae bacterium]